jgi:hypothetical protein
MYQVPFSMTSNFSYQCPLTGETFEFTRDKRSKSEAFAQQQAHTAAEIQRLERLAGRELSFRELIRSSRIEREQAAAKATETPAKQPEAPKPDPLVEQIFQGVTPYMC